VSLLGENIREKLQRSPAGPALREAASYLSYPIWRVQGSNPPAPPHAKRRIIAEYAHVLRPSAFVETGTFRGDTVAYLAKIVDRVISIELDRVLYDAATQRFASTPNVQLINGDSEMVLPELIGDLDVPALFWLDGHFSGGPTALAGTSRATPVVAELEALISSSLPHVVLIDDARLFDGTEGYPRLGEVRDLCQARRPDWSFLVEDDIIRIVPRGVSQDC